MAQRLKVVQVMHAADVIAAAVKRRDVVHFHAVVTPAPIQAASAVGAFARGKTAGLTGVFIPLERGQLSPGPLVLVQEYIGALLAAPPGLPSSERLVAGREGAMIRMDSEHTAGRPPRG